MKSTVYNKLALVTGAARGLGLAITDELSRRGARVVATDVDGRALQAVRRPTRDGQGAVFVEVLDVTDAKRIVELRASVHDSLGPIEILVNNAGVVHGGAFLDVSLDRHLATYRVNVEGLVAVTHAFLPDLIAASAGRLVNIASASGFLALPGATTYGSSKWSVIGFSEGIRLELAEQGSDVRVTTVCPSFVETGMFEGARRPRLTRELRPEEVARRVVDSVERGKRRLLLPALARTAPLFVALPARLADMISRGLGITTSMRNWRGRDQ